MINPFVMMKYIFISLFFLSIFNFTDAQWYNRRCDVVNLSSITSDQFDCMWRKSTRFVWAGAITTALGTATFISGATYMTAHDPCTHSGNYMIGGMIAFSGLCIDLVGIPVWIFGAIRRGQIIRNINTISLASGSINISPVVDYNQFNDSHSLGISISLNF